jgi:uncharacterized protein (DUF1778 family)
MKRRSNDQITLRVAGELRATLEAEAAAESRGLSNFIRKLLLEHATRYTVERAGADAEGAR